MSEQVKVTEDFRPGSIEIFEVVFFDIFYWAFGEELTSYLSKMVTKWYDRFVILCDCAIFIFLSLLSI